MRTIIIFLMILVSSNLCGQRNNGKELKMRERPRILIKYGRPDNKNSEGSQKLYDQRTIFETKVAIEIGKEFPCAIIRTYTEIQEFAADEGLRNNAKDDHSSLTQIGKLLECDIMIVLTSYQLGDKYSFFASVMDERHAMVRSKNQSMGNQSDIGYEGIIKQLINDLVKMELCAYKGEITFSSVTTYKDSQERDGLPGQDCDFKATKVEDKKTEQSWTFQKLKRREGTAKVNYSISNYKKSSERDNCHHCNKMENGVKLDVFEPERVEMQETTEVTETYLANKTAQVEGTSLASMNALTIITFNTLVNNYTITIKAVTQPAKWNIKSVNTNSGCPYDENFENELGAIIAKPCNRVLGPFPGSPYQKNLRQSITKTIVDPDSNGKGKTVETISFNLTR